MSIPAYPLQWPAGWKRTPATAREQARFGKARSQRFDGSWQSPRNLTISEAAERVRSQLQKLGVHDDDLVISSNLLLRLDGQPRSGQAEPVDPGIAVYWRDKGETRCMAIDRYDRAADNLAAIAATLDGMRTIERHGGAAILDRAFTNFTALPPPSTSATAWHLVLGVPAHASTVDVTEAWKRLRNQVHPDKGGSGDAFHAVNQAYAAFKAERGLP